MIHAEINATSTDTLQPPLNESALLQELVAQFLAHDGYVETARAFAEEVATETAALQNGQREPLKKYEVEEDREAINRNSNSPLPPHFSHFTSARPETSVVVLLGRNARHCPVCQTRPCIGDHIKSKETILYRFNTSQEVDRRTRCQAAFGSFSQPESRII